MECPNCGLLSPEGSTRCDCGYDFQSGTMPPRNKTWWEKYGIAVFVISAVIWAATIIPRYATLGFHLEVARTQQSLGELLGANLWVAGVWFLFIYSARITFRKKRGKKV
jgi:hypothetical protein